jgi:hypothetical protein
MTGCIGLEMAGLVLLTAVLFFVGWWFILVWKRRGIGVAIIGIGFLMPASAIYLAKHRVCVWELMPRYTHFQEITGTTL